MPPFATIRGSRSVSLRFRGPQTRYLTLLFPRPLTLSIHSVAYFRRRDDLTQSVKKNAAEEVCGAGRGEKVRAEAYVCNFEQSHLLIRDNLLSQYREYSNLRPKLQHDSDRPRLALSVTVLEDLAAGSRNEE